MSSICFLLSAQSFFLCLSRGFFLGLDMERHASLPKEKQEGSKKGKKRKKQPKETLIQCKRENSRRSHLAHQVNQLSLPIISSNGYVYQIVSGENGASVPIDLTYSAYNRLTHQVSPSQSSSLASLASVKCASSWSDSTQQERQPSVLRFFVMETR